MPFEPRVHDNSGTVLIPSEFSEPKRRHSGWSAAGGKRLLRRGCQHHPEVRLCSSRPDIRNRKTLHIDKVLDVTPYIGGTLRSRLSARGSEERNMATTLNAKIDSVAATHTTGIAFPRYFTARLESGKTPYDEVQWETRTASIGNDKGVGHLRTARRRGARGLVADRHQHRRQQVLLRQDGLARSRNQRRPARRARGRTPSPIGARKTAIFDRPRTARTSASSWRI